MVGGTAVLKNSERYYLKSMDIGQEFEISVALPDGYHEDSREYPVLITLDANFSFFSTAEQARILTRDIMTPVRPMIVVGVGYSEASGQYGNNVLRCRDFTPPGSRLFPNARDWGIPEHMCGGADLFLVFLESQVLPSVRSRYRVENDRMGLFGFSYGGLFAAYTLFNRSPSFDTYIIGSLGALHENDIIFEIEQKCAEAGNALNARALLTYAVGERTGNVSMYNMLVRNCMRMAEILEHRNYQGFQWSIVETAGDTHMTGYVPSLHKGLTTLYPQLKS